MYTPPLNASTNYYGTYLNNIPDTTFHKLIDSIKLEISDSSLNEIVQLATSNSTIFFTILAWSIPVIVAGIAGWVNLKQVRLNVITSARIKWCDEMRESIGHVYSSADGTINEYKSFLHYKMRAVSKSKNIDHYVERQKYHYNRYSDEFRKFNVFRCKVITGLTVNNSLHKTLCDEINKLDKAVADAENFNPQNLGVMLENVLTAARLVMRDDWNLIMKKNHKRKK